MYARGVSIHGESFVVDFLGMRKLESESEGVCWWVISVLHAGFNDRACPSALFGEGGFVGFLFFFVGTPVEVLIAFPVVALLARSGGGGACGHCVKDGVLWLLELQRKSFSIGTAVSYHN